MIEDSKYDISDTHAMLNPFNQVNIVMEKVFVNSKNQNISIDELWEQIKKIKNHIGLSLTKDGINYSSDNFVQSIQNTGSEQPDVGNNETMNELPSVPKNMNIPRQNSSEKIMSTAGNNATLLSNNEGKLGKLMEIINDQNKRLEQFDSRLIYLANRAEDKYENYDQEIYKLLKSRIDDIENQCRNQDVSLQTHIDNQKQDMYKSGKL